MTITAITEHIDYNIFFELLTIFGCNFCSINHRLWVIAINVENWRLHH